ncbi:MAG: phosphoribosyl-AMP cyclohydrolase [Gammaproteobacteria bacterium]|nr:phosphoribosyl-AMP cyclohydrolase [Gammaproteobacteria bacterium]
MTGPDFQKNELIPVVAQNHDDGKVLMLAYMNREAYEETIRTRNVCYYSRSRQTLWRKGETSGHVQKLKHIYYDCDADAVLVKVEQVGGAACHEGYESCFFREIDPVTREPTIIAERVFDPQAVYGSK